MKFVTWNLNSVTARLQHLRSYLESTQPDVVLLQELKCQTENFPAMEIEDLGYNIAIHGQKSYNGVAILSKHKIEDVITKLPGEDTDLESRYIEAVIKDTRVTSIYVPNGMEAGSDKFQYKLRFFKRLHAHFADMLKYNEKFVIGGDFNVAPDPIDVHDPIAMNGSICFHPEERAGFRAIEYLGLLDAYRALNPGRQKFSWWDYRAGAYQQNKGMRIDHLLLSPEAADLLEASDIDTAPREQEKPSDHAPVWCKLK